MSNINTIRNFFYPESVLLIGASSKPKSIGYEILRGMIDFGYKGKIFVVNPKNEEILGIKCNKSIEEIEENISLAIILVPKQLVIDSLKSCAKKNIKNIVVITAGFREVGEEGAKLEQELLDIAKENEIRLVGPNCMGLINTDEDVKLNSTFAAEVPHYAPISFLSQSGALAAAVLNTIKETGYTFGQFISIGNKADLNENDFLEYWHKDDKTKIITMYLESFESGRKFFELAKVITKYKPVLVLKAAKTKSGSRAASSHTGAMATQDDIVDIALKQSGCIRVNTIEEMFETAKAFLKFSNLKGNRLVILTNAGGPAILCVDEAEKNGFEIVKLSDETKNRLRKFLHPEASVNNPVDMLPNADAQTYRKAVQIISQDENVDAIISIFVEPVMIDAFEVIHQLAEEQRINKKPIVVVAFPLPQFWNRWRVEGIKDAYILKSVELASVVLKNLHEYHTSRSLIQNEIVSFDKSQKEKIEKLINNFKFNLKGKNFLTSLECNKILKTCQLPLIKSHFFKKRNELNSLSRKINYPCVLKISSRMLTHKSDFDGVIVNIQSRKNLIQSFDDLLKNLKKKRLINFIDEFEIQGFIDGDVEVIIGGYRDESFGPVVMFGAGGKFVETIKDKNLLLAPVNESIVIEMIKSSKIYPILSGYRNIKKTDIKKLAEIIVKVGNLLNEFGEIKEIDLNPVMIKGKKIKIVDYRIRIVESQLEKKQK